MSEAIYILIKNWLGCLAVSLFFIVVLVKPEVITKYGLRTKIIDNIVRFFALLLAFLMLLPTKGLMNDTFGFFQKGDKYLNKTVCEVVRETHTVWFPFIQRIIYCKNNQHFVDRFTASFYHKGDAYEIIYLPKTKLIVDKKVKWRR